MEEHVKNPGFGGIAYLDPACSGVCLNFAMRWWWLVLVSWVLGSGLVLALVPLGWLAWEWYYAERIYPGVHVGVVDLSGLTLEEAETRLRQVYTFPTQGQVRFRFQDQEWQARPVDLGLVIDYAATVRAAWEVGRQGPWQERWRARWQAWTRGVNLPLVVVYHQEWTYAYLTNVMSQYVETPPQDAYLALEGTRVVYRRGVPGQRIAWPALLQQLTQAFARMQNPRVELPLETVPPQILQAQELAQALESLMAQGVELYVPQGSEDDPGPWRLTPEQLVSMLRIVRQLDPHGRARYVLEVDPSGLDSLLQTITAEVLRDPVNPRFAFDPETRQLELLEPAVYGRRLKVEATRQAFVQAVGQGQTRVPLVLDIRPPQVTDDATAEELGIRELIVEHTTYFYGSSPERMHNIQLAGSKFNGYLVAPGEVFSMVQVLGDISLENGYLEAPIIFGNRTIQGVGGGVCQVSTTLFRTVFFAGYPIVERYPHSYRVYYYELEASGRANPRWAGLDATVYVPVVDFKFKNDTPYWILMEVEVNIPHRYIRWRLYSTSDGREVVWRTTGVQDREPPPPPRYIENPELEPGEVRQTDWPVEGGVVTVTRWVYRDGELLYEDVFTTRYRPWPAVCEYGPGTEGMPPEEPDPENPCKPRPKQAAADGTS